MHRVGLTTRYSTRATSYKFFVRSLSSSLSPPTNLSPEEAGRLAESIAQDGDESGSPQHVQMESIATRLAHSGMTSQDVNAAMAPPIHLSTTYSRPANGQYNESDSIYSRADNPTRLLLERAMFKLEYSKGPNDGKEQVPDSMQEETSLLPSSYAFSSGMMAVSSIILSHTPPITILLPEDVYHGVPTVAVDVFSRFDVKVERVNMLEASNIRDTIQKLDEDDSSSSSLKETEQSEIIVWIETPSNPMCQVTCIRSVCDIAQSVSLSRKKPITTVVDSTLSPPVLTQPLHVSCNIAPVAAS